jgi:hypothetical protein
MARARGLENDMKKIEHARCGLAGNITLASLLLLFGSQLSSVATKGHYYQPHQFHGELNAGEAGVATWTWRGGTTAENPDKKDQDPMNGSQVVAIPSLNTIGINSVADKSISDASSSYTLLSAPRPGGGFNLSGSVEVVGNADAKAKLPGFATAGSFSSLTVKAGRCVGTGRRQHWTWRSVITANAYGSTSDSALIFGKDPVGFTLFNDVTGETIEGNLLEIPYALNGLGELYWDADVFSISAANAEFHIALDSPYVLQYGRVDLVIQDGLIATATDEGIFEGWLSGIQVGGPADFSLPMLNDINFDVDFSSVVGAGNPDDWSADMHFYNESYTSVMEVPEPTAAGILAVFFVAQAAVRALRANNGRSKARA